MNKKELGRLFHEKRSWKEYVMFHGPAILLAVLFICYMLMFYKGSAGNAFEIIIVLIIALMSVEGEHRYTQHRINKLLSALISEDAA